MKPHREVDLVVVYPDHIPRARRPLSGPAQWGLRRRSRATKLTQRGIQTKLIRYADAWMMLITIVSRLVTSVAL